MTDRERPSAPRADGLGSGVDADVVEGATEDPDGVATEAPVTLVAAARGAPGAFEIVDSIEEVRLPVAVETDGTVARPPRVRAERVAAADRFAAPVDACWRIDATAVVPLCTADVYVRDADNRVVATATAEAPARVPAGPHVLELSTAPLKTYVALEGPGRVSYENQYPRVSVAGGGLVVGARSRRTTPAGTVTVPETPAGVARAISTFGSALATTSPERSFPTLRGHPPLFERGETFETPRFVERVDTDVALGLPFEYDALYAAAPLAFYLAATVVESDAPYLRTGDVRHDLPSEPDALASTLGAPAALFHPRLCDARVLGRAVRRRPRRPRDPDRTPRPPWEAWYEASLAERTAAYLEVPTAATLDCLEWPYTTDVTPADENASVLPFLAADLSVVRSPPPRPESEAAGVGQLDDFVRASSAAVEAATLTRSASDGDPPGLATDAVPASLLRGSTQNDGDDSETVVTPVPADSIAQSWVGPGYPMGAAKPTVEAYRRRLDRTPAEDLTIGVTVVCNDEAMVEELGDTYGFRDHVTFDIREERDLTVAELRALLSDDHDFFHYVGHVDERGMQCADGFLDLRDLAETGVDAFLLNACTSYRQGMALVEAGALGGVVSLTDLPNSLATRVGRDLARLFDAGFPLYAALDVVGTGPFAGNAYSIVGDPLVQLCQCTTAVAYVLNVEDIDLDSDSVDLVPQWYPTLRHGLGGMSRPIIRGVDMRWIGTGRGDTIETNTSALVDCSKMGRFPIRVGRELIWNIDISDQSLSTIENQLTT
ncbi:caspase family protein [Halobaculum litoreum]|uniref:Caspase family protein n=1 Tax=Halobaculum litoreum TaxID=3031998 RepID=A0ABD5XRF6_9EURY